MIKAKAKVSQSELFENFSDCFDWLDKNRPFKKPLLFWSCKQANEVVGPLNLSVGLQPINQSTGKYYVKLTENLRKNISYVRWCFKDNETSFIEWTFEPPERDKFTTSLYYDIGYFFISLKLKKSINFLLNKEIIFF